MKKILMFLLVCSGIAPLFGINGLTSKDLHQKARLIGFNGDVVEESKLISFDGDGNWFQGMRSFTMTITNDTTLPREVVLFPAYMWNPLLYRQIGQVALQNTAAQGAHVTLGGQYTAETKSIEFDDHNALVRMILNATNVDLIDTVDNSLIASDGIIFTDDNGKSVSCQGNPSQIRNFITYLLNHPSWLQAIKIRSTDPAQLQQNLKVREINPFFDDRNYVVPLTKFTTNKDQQNNLIDIAVGMTIGDLVEMKLNVTKNSTCDITFFFGGSVNTSDYLTKKAKEVANSAPRQIA